MAWPGVMTGRLARSRADGFLGVSSAAAGVENGRLMAAESAC